MASHKLAHITLDGLNILGYSVAGEENVVAFPQLDVCFDIGKAPQQIIPVNHVLLTHGHIDHSSGIAFYFSHRNFCGMSAGTIFAPQPLADPIRSVLDGWSLIDGTPIPANIVGVKSGDLYQIKPNLFARVFATRHTRGSVGYAIIEKRKKLKPEYLKLSGAEIVELKKKNAVIDMPLEIPIVSYFGDTEYFDLSGLDFVLDSKILITECTFFLEEHNERADVGRHIHLNDFAMIMEQSRNKYIILMHVTQRTGMGEIRRMLKSKLPKSSYEKIIVLIEDEFIPLGGNSLLEQK